jgi:hypothetical protein
MRRAAGVNPTAACDLPEIATDLAIEVSLGNDPL